MIDSLTRRVTRLERKLSAGQLNTRRIKIWTQQRSAGRHIIGPVFARWEHHDWDGMGYLNLTVGNPKVHYRWAFNVFFYYKGV